MNILFNINYYTQNSENIFLNIIEDKGVKKIKMRSDSKGNWSVKFETTRVKINYYYSVNRIKEYSQRTISLVGVKKELIVSDLWRNEAASKTIFTSPFKNIFIDRAEPKGSRNNRQLILNLEFPYVFRGERLVVVGSSRALGEWNVDKAPALECVNYPFWQVKLNPQDLVEGSEYKFVVVDKKGNHIWESGQNRVWSAKLSPLSTHHISLTPPNIEKREWKGAGVAIPVFSLRSEDSCGIGDFSDLAKFVKWCGSIGGSVVQILPINDTTSTHTNKDSYPYSAISVFALHPLYLSLEDMGRLNDNALSDEIFAQGERLNALEALDYAQISALKWRYFRAIYAQDGQKVLGSSEFKSFYKRNKSWLLPYAIFCYNRDKYSTIIFSNWPQWSSYDSSEAKKAVSELSPIYHEIAIHLFLQFHLDLQLRKVRVEAEKVGVALKGDIPIGVSRYSVETWSEPNLFNLESQAGAPPDDFAVNGQNWGFPTYNWDVMERDGYRWWKQRFAKMYDYFELYRVDHILGFFRIWQIPSSSVEGLLGSFQPALPLSKRELSLSKLPMDKKRYLSPYLHIETLTSLFDSRELIDEFMERVGKSDYYTLKPEFDTQRKIESYLISTSRVELRELLFRVVNDVLFVRDSSRDEKFHPRICGHSTFAYAQNLTNEQRKAYDRLYDDFYYHRHNEYWAQNALKKLPALISTTSMLCCAEDLGMIPDSVPRVLSELEIITLEVERMPKLPFQQFGDVDRYPYLSVATTSTHDMSPIRLWWQQMEQSQRDSYYTSVLGLSAPAPLEATAQVCRQIVKRHLNAPSILAILPLQDLLSTYEQTRVDNHLLESEQINVPSNPNHYWRYRMHLTIEELQNNPQLNWFDELR